MSLTLFYLVAAVVLLVGAAALARLFPWSFFAALAVLTAAATAGATSPLIDVEGIQIYGGDLLALVAGGAAAAHPERVARNLGVKAVAAGLLAAVLIYNFLVGWQAYGVTAANEFRATLYLFAVLAFVLSLDMAVWRPKIVNYYVWLSLALSGIAAYRWMTRGFGKSGELLLINGEYRTTRALIAPQALVIAIGALISLYSWAETRRHHHLVAGCWLVLVVVLLQHRSVWAAMAAGIMFGVVSVRFELQRRVLVALAAGVILIAPAVLLGAGGSALSNVAESASDASLASATFKFRTDGWVQLIQGTRDSGYQAVLFGQPFGTSLARLFNGQIVTVSAHNFFVSIYLRAGVIGLAALIFMFLMIRRGDWPPRVAIAAALTTYSVAYSIDHFSAPILAVVLLALGAGQDRDQPPTTSSPPDAVVVGQPPTRRVLVGAAGGRGNAVSTARLRVEP